MALADTTLGLIEVEVAYANANDQAIIRLKVTADCSVESAIMQSGVLKRFPEIDLSTMQIGIFSKRVGLKTVLQQNDRVEIYRSLLIDPKQARRSRAVRSK